MPRPRAYRTRIMLLVRWNNLENIDVLGHAPSLSPSKKTESNLRRKRESTIVFAKRFEGLRQSEGLVFCLEPSLVGGMTTTESEPHAAPPMAVVLRRMPAGSIKECRPLRALIPVVPRLLLEPKSSRSLRGGIARYWGIPDHTSSSFLSMEAAGRLNPRKAVSCCLSGASRVSCLASATIPPPSEW